MATETENQTKPKAPHYGIPKAIFIEDIDTYLKENRMANVEEALRFTETMYSKYKIMEQNLHGRRKRFKMQLPDIAKNIEVVNYLLKNQIPFETTFEVADQLYARAHVEEVSKVGLWLGANVMLEYELPEAKALLQKNHDAASAVLKDLDRDVDYLKDQITTTEVNMARLHNLAVIARRQK